MYKYLYLTERETDILMLSGNFDIFYAKYNTHTHEMYGSLLRRGEYRLFNYQNQRYICNYKYLKSKLFH